jgi:hypothetical protein
MKNQNLQEIKSAHKLEIKKLKDHYSIMKKLTAKAEFYNSYFELMKNQNLEEFKKAQTLEIEKLQDQNSIMKKLSTKTGFYNYYYQLMKTIETEQMAFEEVNKLYFKLFGEVRYKNFESFKFSVSKLN